MSKRDDALTYQRLSGEKYTTALRATSNAPSWHPTPGNHLLLMAPPSTGGTAAIDYLLAMDDDTRHTWRTEWRGRVQREVLTGRRGHHEIMWVTPTTTKALPLAFQLPPTSLGYRTGEGWDLMTVSPGDPGCHRIIVVDPLPESPMRHPVYRLSFETKVRELLDSPHTTLVLRMETTRVPDDILPADVLARFDTVLTLPNPTEPGAGWIRHGVDVRPVQVPWHVPTLGRNWPGEDQDVNFAPHLLIGGVNSDARANGVRYAVEVAEARGAHLLRPERECPDWWTWDNSEFDESVKSLEAVVDEALRLTQARAHEMASEHVTTATTLGLDEVFLFTGNIAHLLHPQLKNPEPVAIVDKLARLLRAGRSAGIRVVGQTHLSDLRDWDSGVRNQFARLLMGPSSLIERDCFLRMPEGAHGVPETLHEDEGIAEFLTGPQWIKVPLSRRQVLTGTCTGPKEGVMRP